MFSNRKQRGFTLIELLVVIGIIALALAIVLPSIVSLFNQSADAQARQLLSAMLTSARGLATRLHCYTLVHSQIGPDGKCYLVVMKQDADGMFRPAPGFAPQMAPGDMVYGQAFWGKYGGLFKPEYFTTDSQIEDYCNFDTVFSPEGATDLYCTPQIDWNVPIFTGNGSPKILNPRPPPINWTARPDYQLLDRVIYQGVVWRCWSSPIADNGSWGPSTPPPGWPNSITPWHRDCTQKAFTVFSYPAFRAKTPTDRAAFVKSYASWLCLNSNTGQLLPYK